MIARLALASVLLAAPLSASAATTAWTTDATSSTLTFSGSADGENFTGTFKSFDAAIVFDPADLPGSSFDVNIDLTSAESGNSDRDETLQTEEFFNSAKQPKAHFKATQFIASAPGKFTANGTLELNGESKPVALVFTWKADAKAATLTGETVLDRTQFNVGIGDWAEDTTITHQVVVKTTLQLTAK